MEFSHRGKDYQDYLRSQVQQLWAAGQFQHNFRLSEPKVAERRPEADNRTLRETFQGRRYDVDTVLFLWRNQESVNLPRHAKLLGIVIELFMIFEGFKISFRKTIESNNIVNVTTERGGTQSRGG